MRVGERSAWNESTPISAGVYVYVHRRKLFLRENNALAASDFTMYGGAQNRSRTGASFAGMLYELLRTNRRNLIERCRLKVSQRDSPPATANELQYGVPLMLDQLSEALVREEEAPTPQEDAVFGYSPDTTGSMEAGRTAALHGSELFRLGYSVDQVVHDYGDLCQAITELAKEVDAGITVDEFHTFNRLLDQSIADAVSAYVRHQHSSNVGEGARVMHDRLGSLADEQRVLLDTALKALDALKVGNIGLMGATGTVLEDSLLKLRNLIDRSLPEIRTTSGMVSHPDPEAPHPKRPDEQTAAGALT